MKNILHLERKFTSPTETFIVNQVNTISAFKPFVFTVRNCKNLNCDAQVIEAENISQSGSGARYLSSRNAESMRKQLSGFSFALIHTHYTVDAIFYHKLTRQFKVPKICSGYGYDVTSFPRQYFGLPKYFLNILWREYDLFLAMSDDMKKDFVKLGCPENKIRVHYYGTDSGRFINKARNYELNGKVKILTVGTVETKKAQHLVVEALAILRDKHGLSEFEYHIVGGGDFNGLIKNRVFELGLSDAVFYHGYVPHNSPELIEHYNSADLFILPSITTDKYDKEGIPGTLIEAMANGLPVISTKHAGIPYAVETEKEGILTEEKNPAELAIAMARLIKDKELRKSIGTSAQIKAGNELDLHHGTKRLEKIYSGLIDGYKY